MLDVGDVLILFYHISRLSRTICWGVLKGAGITWVAHPCWTPLGAKVLLDVQEGYQWNSLKGLRFLEWCSSNVLAEFLVKVDDDVRLDADFGPWGITNLASMKLMGLKMILPLDVNCDSQYRWKSFGEVWSIPWFSKLTLWWTNIAMENHHC